MIERRYKKNYKDRQSEEGDMKKYICKTSKFNKDDIYQCYETNVYDSFSKITSYLLPQAGLA